MAFQRLDLIQGTPEWLAKRREHLTASQTPTLFDLNPYETRLQLFEEKALGMVPEIDAFKQRLYQKGHDAEDSGREWAKQKLGLAFEPAVLVSVEHPDLLASLDGMAGDTIFEAKYMGAEKLRLVREGVIPPNHVCQVQAQLLVSGAAVAVYFAMTDGGEAAMAEIKPDRAYQEQIAESAAKFMAQVRAGEMPEPSERDFVTVQDPRFEELARLEGEKKAIAAKYDALEEELLGTYKHRRFRAGPVSVTRFVQKGNVDYSKIPMLKGVDLDKYRKGPSERVRVTIKKGA